MPKDPGHAVVMLVNAHDRHVDCRPEKVAAMLATGEFKFLPFHSMTKKELHEVCARYGFGTKKTVEVEAKTKGGKPTTKQVDIDARDLGEELRQRDVALVLPHLPPKRQWDDPKNKLMKMALRDAGLLSR